MVEKTHTQQAAGSAGKRDGKRNGCGPTRTLDDGSRSVVTSTAVRTGVYCVQSVHNAVMLCVVRGDSKFQIDVLDLLLFRELYSLAAAFSEQQSKNQATHEQHTWRGHFTFAETRDVRRLIQWDL